MQLDDMKSIGKLLVFLLMPVLIVSIATGCSSDDSDNESTEFNILVLDVDTNNPVQGALVEICNNPFFCTNVLAHGTTNASGKIRLTLSKSDMSIAESFTVYADGYMNETLFIEFLDLSQEIVVRIRKP